MFSENGYFYDVPLGQKYFGGEVGAPIDDFDSAFPDMHHELFKFYVTGDAVVVELALRGTHLGDFPH